MPRPGSGPTRRTLIGAVAVAGVGSLVSGCRGGSPQSAAATTPPAIDPTIQRNRQLLSRRAQAEAALIREYEATLATHPALSPQLATPLAHHRAHLTLLGNEITRTGTRDPADPRSPSPSGSPGPASLLPVSPNPAVAVANLAARESVAARSLRSSCAQATGSAAGLLGSIGAAEATHADLLSVVG